MGKGRDKRKKNKKQQAGQKKVESAFTKAEKRAARAKRRAERTGKPVIVMGQANQIGKRKIMAEIVRSGCEEIADRSIRIFEEASGLPKDFKVFK